MAEPVENPFQAPRADLRAGALPKVTKRDMLIAQRMLVYHERGGVSFGLFARWSAVRYFIIFGYLAAVAGLAVMAQFWVGLAIVAGVALGFALCEIRWVRGSKQAWPFNEMVIDWDRVQSVADGVPPGPKS
ncbi:MAG: hypothetical protein U0835_06560 [Isosphaeraceae bacterium]